MNAEVLRLLLAVSLVAMYVLAMLYLRRRRLGLGAYLFWGLFALSIPALGPFLVILTSPGSMKYNPQKTRAGGHPGLARPLCLRHPGLAARAGRCRQGKQRDPKKVK